MISGLPVEPSEVRVRDKADISRAAAALARYASHLGKFRAAVCANISSSRPMTDAHGRVLANTVFGWNAQTERWWDDRSLALHSPITQLCRYESEALWVNSQGAHTHGPGNALDSFDLAQLNGIVKVRAAIVVPVHLPFSQVGAATYTCIDDARDDLSVEYERYGATLQLLTQIFIGSYVRHTAANARIPHDGGLSKRQAQCLRWAAVGKTDEEIAELISRTHATVRYHLQASNSKLNAVTRTQAVFKATQLGYLGKPF